MIFISNIIPIEFTQYYLQCLQIFINFISGEHLKNIYIFMHTDILCIFLSQHEPVVREQADPPADPPLQEGRPDPASCAQLHRDHAG